VRAGPRSRTDIPPSGAPGYVLLLALLVLVVVGLMASGLFLAIVTNQQHVSRDRAYTQSLAVAEAGLNQYLWMVASGQSSEANGFAIPGNTGPDVHKETMSLESADASAKGTYTLLVTPPTGDDPRIGVTVTGLADSGVDVDRTVSAHIGRPSFCDYILLVDQSVYIGGAPDYPDREWHGKTHSNTGIRIETYNINDTVTCAQSSYVYNGTTEPGVWSQYISAQDGSRALWKYPVPPIDFNTITSDFVKLSGKATGINNLPYVTPSPAGAAHGWYIKLLPGEKYQVAQVTDEKESKNYSNGNNKGGYLTYGPLSAVRDYPASGVIYSNDNVWVEGTNLDGRITIACSGQLNPVGEQAATSVNVVGDLTYSAKDGTVVVGLIAQNNVKIPMYAPLGKDGDMGASGKKSTISMEIDAAMIAQEGAEYVSRDSSGNGNGWGPRRLLLSIYGSVCSHDTPTRETQNSNGNDFAGFEQGSNVYDPFLLHQPPPFFPTIGSFQILDWRELPSTQAVSPD
jgi:hypothetical protein